MPEMLTDLNIKALKKQMYKAVHLLFHIPGHSFIDFPGGVFMKNSTFILTEQRRSIDKSPICTIIQQTITAWLTKELYK